MRIYDAFKNCSSEYRSAPFWSWNDELDRTELVRQIHEMHEQGMGGFFMHPRGGLVDRYLGESFMEAVKVCVKEAEKLGMKAWLYDEDRFPSGFAGGMVVKGNPVFAAKALTMTRMRYSEAEKDAETVRIFPCRNGEIDGDAMVFKVVDQPKQLRYDHTSYPDLSNKEAVDAFIEITHEAYKRETGEYLGNVVPGIFTDEPHFNPRVQGKLSLPWSLRFEEIFKEQKGYDILDHFPALFTETEGYEKFRFDFWDVLSSMFVEAFSQNIYDWCGKNGLQFTGHFWEHVFPSPLYTGSVMPHYEFMHVPGIDMLFNTEERKDQFGNVLIVKEVSSAANQLGKERVLSETYGGSGWELTFEEQKRVADWQFALGVNLVCQHLVLFSLRGFRKRDFPLSFLDHQPWWNAYHILGDYIGRLSYILSQGDFVGDILVLHPSSSTWVEYNGCGENGEMLEEIEESVKELLVNLSGIQYYFHLGDDILMERHGRVEDNKLIIGKMTYSTVLVPSMTVMRSTSFELLKAFAGKGGRIAAAGTTPTLLDGEESRELKDFFESSSVIRIDNEQNALKGLLGSWGNLHTNLEELDGKDTRDIYCHERRCEEARIIFLCNISKSETYQIRLRLDGASMMDGNHIVEEWDPVTGERMERKPGKDGNGWYVDLEFHPVGSRLMVIHTAGVAHDASFEKSCFSNDADSSRDTLSLYGWKAERTDYNALTLNRCSISLDGGEWEAEDNVLLVDDALKDRLGLERSHIFSRQPWMYTEEEKSRTYGLRVKYRFYAGEKLTGDVYAVIEQPEAFKVHVNGRKVENTGKTYKDRAFIMYDIGNEIVRGWNEIMLDTEQFGLLLGLESLYLAGDFKVIKGSMEGGAEGFILMNEDGSLGIGDWTGQGYPYYSGTVRYTAEFVLENAEPENAAPGNMELVLGEFWGSAARVLVNGHSAAVLGWKPYKADITPFVQKGKNEVVIEVMNSLQNLLGPHHHLKPEGLVTPGSFYSKEDVKFVKSGFDGKAEVKL